MPTYSGALKQVLLQRRGIAYIVAWWWFARVVAPVIFTFNT